MEIEWAPVKVPSHQRMQTFAAGLFMILFFVLPTISFFLFLGIVFYGSFLTKALTALYFTYIYYDHTRRNSAMDGNGWHFLRDNFSGRNLRDYFPVELMKTVDLSPDRNYIIASFPHGVIGTGILNNMIFDIGKWMKLFPGIRPKVATLAQYFCVPISREYIRLYGFVSVSKESLTYYLTKSNNPNHPENLDGFTSNAVAVVVGGAQEAFDSHPGRYILTLKNRKGFVKLAIKTGCPIVPSFSFGEVDIFEQVDNAPGTWLRRFQSFTKGITGISPVFILGRGFFQNTFGLMPQRKRIVQVLGAPIEVEKIDKPDQKYVDEIHEKFIAALSDLFETHKVKYLEDASEVKLVIN